MMDSSVERSVAPEGDANTVTTLDPVEKRRYIERIHQYLRWLLVGAPKPGGLSDAVNWVSKTKQFELLASTGSLHADYGATFDGFYDLVEKARKAKREEEIEDAIEDED